MEKWETTAERMVREAIERGEFDNLPGKGQPLNLEQSPFSGPLDATIRRILRDNGVAHPIAEARRAIEDELEAARQQFRRDRNEIEFRTRIAQVNREVRLFNLRSPILNFHILPYDAASELERMRLPKPHKLT